MLFLLLISCTYSFAQIVNIPNANFKARLLASNATNYIAENTIGYSIKIDTNNDGQIQVSEALQVISLDVNTAGISNLEGISSFTNLIHLNCSQNYLTTLNF